MSDFFYVELAFFGILDIIVIAILCFTNKIRPLNGRVVLKLSSYGSAISIIVAILLTGLNVLASNAKFMKEYANTSAGTLTNSTMPIWIIIFVSGISAPIIEEALFRVGIYEIFNKTGKRDTPNKLLFCILGTNIFFAGFHNGIVQMIYSFILGIVMSVIYIKNEKNATAPITFHLSFNITSIVASIIVSVLL